MKQKNLKLIDFRPDHVHQIKPREEEAFGVCAEPGYAEKMISVAQGSKVSGTFIIGGEILCIAGYYELWSGVAEVWAMPSIYVRKNALLFARTFKAWVEDLIENHKYHRLQVHGLDDKTHNRWFQWLGFEKEGVMRKYSRDMEDFAMYARVV